MFVAAHVSQRYLCSSRVQNGVCVCVWSPERASVLELKPELPLRDRQSLTLDHLPSNKGNGGAPEEQEFVFGGGMKNS